MTTTGHLIDATGSPHRPCKEQFPTSSITAAVAPNRNVELDQLRRLLVDQYTRSLDVIAEAGTMRAVGGQLVLDGTEPQLGPDGVTMTSGIYRVNDIVVVNEAQDLHARWTLLRSLTPVGPDDLFIVGDTFQRVYDNRVTLGHLGIDIRGRSHRLTINYRTTRQILASAIGLVDPDGYDDLDGGADTLRGYRSVLRDAAPEITGYAATAAELSGLAARIRRWRDGGIPLDEIAVIARTNATASAAVTALRFLTHLTRHPS